MANNDTEIEIKIPVGEKTFSRVRKQLENIAEFVSSVKHLDKYFTPVHRNFVEPKFPYEWFSIRKRGDKNILNYKHYYPENAEVTTHSDEFETEIEKPEKLEKILSALDFEELVTVDKKREVYVYKDELEISLDKVEELGNFIEIEAIRHFDSVEETRKKLFEFAEFLGLEEIKTDKRGYPYLLMQKKGLIKYFSK